MDLEVFAARLLDAWSRGLADHAGLARRLERLIKMGYTREGLAERYRDVAEKQVRRHLILSKIVDQEGLVLSEEELDAGIREIADSYGQPYEEFKGFYEKDKDQLEYLKHTLLEKKALRLIIDSSRIEEVEPEKESPQGAGEAQGGEQTPAE